MPETKTQRRHVKWSYTMYFEADVDEAEVEGYYGEPPTDEQIKRTVTQYMYDGDGSHIHGLLGDTENSPYGDAGSVDVEVLHYCEKHPKRLVEDCWGRGKGWCIDCWSEDNDNRKSHRAGQFPILKRRLAPDDYLDIGCCACGRVWRAESVDDSITWVECRSCPHCGSGRVEYRFWEGVACGGCDELAMHYPKELEHCCSRSCMLQARYKRELPLRRAIADPEATRDTVAEHYRALLRKEADWPDLNRQIIERWSTAGLAYIKARAWSRMEVAT